MYFSSLNKHDEVVIDAKRIPETSTLGEIAINFGYTNTIYLTRHEANHLYSALFDVLMRFDQEPSNVRVLS